MTIGRAADYEKVETDRTLFAEEQLQRMVGRESGCLLVTHGKKDADYVVEIAVSRFLGNPSTYGEATLTVMRQNGDVIEAEHFYQDAKSADDIAQQPIKQLWNVICRPKTDH